MISLVAGVRFVPLLVSVAVADVVFLQAPVESRTADAECRCHLAEVSFVLIESLENGLPFNFVQGHACIDIGLARGLSRLIVAQAISDRIPLVSSDGKFTRYERYGLDFIQNRR